MGQIRESIRVTEIAVCFFEIFYFHLEEAKHV